MVSVPHLIWQLVGVRQHMLYVVQHVQHLIKVYRRRGIVRLRTPQASYARSLFRWMFLFECKGVIPIRLPQRFIYTRDLGVAVENIGRHILKRREYVVPYPIG